MLEPDEKEQKTLKLMRGFYQMGESLPAISKRLYNAGYESRSGKPFTPMAIRRVIMNDVVGPAS